MKRCYKCKKNKEKREFNKDKTRKDGFRYICKSCEKKYSQSIIGKEVIKRKNKNYIKKNPFKNKASQKLRDAVKSGRIIKPTICYICHKENKIIHGHHDDYSKPLEVIWCCPQCHSDMHNF